MNVQKNSPRTDYVGSGRNHYGDLPAPRPPPPARPPSPNRPPGGEATFHGRLPALPGRPTREGSGQQPGSPDLRRLEHRAHRTGPESLARQPKPLRLPARGTSMADRGIRRRLRRRAALPASRCTRAVHVVVLPRQGLRQRLRLAHRRPGRDPRSRRARRICRGRAAGELRGQMVRPRPRDRAVPHVTELRITTRNARFQQWQALLDNRTKRTRSGQFVVQGVRPISLAVQHNWPIHALIHPLGRPLSDWARGLLDDPSAAAERVAMAPDLLAELADKDAELVAVVGQPPDRLDRIPVP